MAQGLRPSQYITTFGPGALVETPQGPHILLGTSDVLQRIHSIPIDMEHLAIRDIRLQRGLLDGDRIFKIPDNQNWDRFFYPARKFPNWNLCVQHQNFNVIHRGQEGCPECKNETNRRESRKNKYAIRFMIACPNGHLDDVNWSFLIHSRRGERQEIRCASTHFHWLGSGSSLASIKIRCPACSAEKELGEIYSSRLPCRGRRPEARGADLESCDGEAIVVQRGSFSLRLPEVITSLTIPPLVTPIHRVLQRDDIQQLVNDLKELDKFTEPDFRRLIKVRVEKKKLTAQIETQLEQTPWLEIAEALAAIDRSATKKSRAEYLRQEQESLIDVVDTGFPPYPHDSDRRPGEPISFQVEATQIRREVRGPEKKLVFRVMPIERLRVVIVQVGHRRVEYTGPRSVLTRSRGTHPQNPDEYWVPGVEQFGEGVYVDLNPHIEGQSNWYPQGEEARRWDETTPAATGPNELVTWNALSVWWHSFSHRLINAMSLHSGYSSTAIRERVYLTTTDTGEMRGGVLLYTTQPGGDGTMGGLTSLVSDFEHILELALDGVDRCSNDPLCENAEIDPVSKLGAACYSCEMVSETSCEHYNGYLHRGLLLENRP
jgi:hypothetical protein